MTITPTLESISDIFGGPIGGYTKLKSSTMSIAQRDIPGDANNNGRLDVADAAELIRLYARPAQIRSWDHTLNDLNLDTILTEGDATRVLRVVALLDGTPSFPVAAQAMQAFVAAESLPVRMSALMATQAMSSSVEIHASAQAGAQASGDARLVLTRLTGANADKVLAQVYLDNVPAGQAGVSFRIDFPASALRIASASSLIVPAGALPSGASPLWNVAPGNDFANQTGSVSFAAAWGSSHTFPVGQPVANIVFDVQALESGQVHFPVTFTSGEIAPFNENGPASPIALTGQTATFTRTYADWALATLGNANADPDADSDGDGMSNAGEFTASTHPNNSNSLLQTSSAAFTPSGYTLRWFAAYGVNYKVCWSSDLATWHDLTTTAYTGTGAEAEVTDPDPPQGGRFYRVEVITPQD